MQSEPLLILNSLYASVFHWEATPPVLQLDVKFIAPQPSGEESVSIIWFIMGNWFIGMGNVANPPL